MTGKKKPEELITPEAIKAIENMKPPYDYRKTAAVLDDAHKRTQKMLQQLHTNKEMSEQFADLAMPGTLPPYDEVRRFLDQQNKIHWDEDLMLFENANLDHLPVELREEIMEMIRISKDRQTTLKIAAQVKQIREELGISRAELAEMVGTTQAYITRLENNNADPSLSFLKRIAAALGKELYICLK